MKQINYDKIRDNIEQLIKKDKRLMLVLKDNAYNFGLTEVTDIALSLGVKYFAVKNITEALEIRKLSKTAEILLLGKISYNFMMIKKYNLFLSVDTEEERDFCVVNEVGYHLKINSKMNRFGIDINDIEKYITPFLQGIYLHIPTNNLEENIEEIKKITYIQNKYNLYKIDTHIGGSNILAINHDYIYRIGSFIYDDALTMTGKILSIRRLKKGDCLGYNHEYIAVEDCFVGICNLGYVNGLSRTNINNYVYIKEKKYFFVGLKCMDCSFILIDKEVQINDEVWVLGKNVCMQEFCQNNQIIPHQAYLMLK